MTNIIPLDPEKRLEISLHPATLSEVQGAVALLAKAIPIMPSIQDPAAFKTVMAEFLTPYPADVLLKAVNLAIGQFKHMPSIHEMVMLCEQVIAPRRTQLSEHRRLEAAKAEWQRRCREFQARLATAIGGKAPNLNEIDLAVRLAPNLVGVGMPMTWRQLADEDPWACAELCKQLAEIARSERPNWGEIRNLLAINKQKIENRRWRELEGRARERFGDAAPLPGDVALARSISALRVSRAGDRVSWLTALDRGEPWAAKFCRRMALAERTRRAIEQGRISWTECLAICKLISRDEAAARSEVAKAETRQPQPQYAGPPPRSFDSALRRIHKTCGLDVPRSEDPDAPRTAIENLKHLTGLAALKDVREILETQFVKEHPRLSRASASEACRGSESSVSEQGERS